MPILRSHCLTYAFLFFSLAVLVRVPPASAGEPRVGMVVISSTVAGSPNTRVFAPNTPKLALQAELVDVPSGSQVGAAWIAEKVEGAPPNYKIDGNVLDVAPMMNVATFTMTKPTAGWPVGDYRVQLFINGRAAETVNFKVARAETGLMNLREAPRLWENAVEAGDVEAVVALHAPDARLLMPNGQVVAGRDNIRALYRANQAAGKSTIRLTDVQLDGDDRNAIMVWYSTLELTPPDRGPLILKGRAMLHWKHMPDGWYIVHGMVQPLPTQQ